MFLPKSVLILIGVVAIAAMLLVPPYLAWQDYEPDVVVMDAPMPDWDYPYERGFEWHMWWSVSVWETSVYPYATTRDPSTGQKMVDIQVTVQRFDIYDVWHSWDTVEVVLPKPSFTDYLASYYGISALAISGELCTIRLSCFFTDADTGDKRWLDLDSADSTSDIIIPVDEPGAYSGDLWAYTPLHTGEYRWSVVTSVGNGNIGDDYVVVPVVNPYE